ncbi:MULTISPECIES: tripartite tricarboxylate transporter TctB family protein [Anaerotruncus]|jgi:hypothetical protein|uniref:tripartite tricarboxylate transporter TctB family protein n=1 Tax=Anaerotruncus TaxID=244127 RepID=UPI00082A3E00|nr:MULTISPECIES: tripartite tricarboxylate transporter TctB family protein [Anaerotruncus]RGX53625.1 tripartite tricarboxylate transporter TctB family protein [Anaerotruncus sp. AF02-27]
MDQDKKAYRQSLCVAGVIMAFALAAFLLSLPMPDHAPIFPRMASAFLFACGAGLMVGAVRRHRKGLPPETPAVDFGEMQSPLILLLLVVVYALGFKYVGFYVTTLVIVVASMLHMGIRSVKTIALVTVILLAFLFWLFTIQLGIHMPQGILI